MMTPLMAVALAFALWGFHVAVTLLGLYRAFRALRRVRQEGRFDPRTIWRLTMLRVSAVAVVFSALLMGSMFALKLLAGWGVLIRALRGPELWFTIVLLAAWLVWIVSIVALDNFARRWLIAERAAKRDAAKTISGPAAGTPGTP